MSAEKDAAKITAQINKQTRVAKPKQRGGCWARVRRASLNAYHRYTGGRYENCGKKAREGFRTCRYHADREEEAKHYEDS